MNYYNEFDPKTAAWLRELIKQKLIPNGVVDERSIVEVQPDELREYTQCHFFAGIGGWSYALQLAGWPEDEPVWTGSCPCQPFSCAGNQEAQADSRHLWPNFFNLIKECRPQHVFGEQVASAIRHGWLDEVESDLETENYTCGSIVLGAHSVEGPHQRQRLYWAASDTNSQGGSRQITLRSISQAGQWNWRGKEDLQSIANNPFNEGNRWPKPLLRAVDDGLSERVGGCHGAGNAIVPQVAAEFIKAFIDC